MLAFEIRRNDAAQMIFAPDGTILARGLRGEEIEKRLEGIFHNDQ